MQKKKATTKAAACRKFTLANITAWLREIRCRVSQWLAVLSRMFGGV